MQNLFDVEGKVAVVSGGSSGIGAMMARGLLENGAKVYITARRAEPLNAMAEELSEFGECIAIPSDMSSLEGIQSLVAKIGEYEQQIDILINNAGTNCFKSIADVSEEDWDRVMDINIKSIFFATQQFLPLLKAAASSDDPARIINIASVHGIRNPGIPSYPYSASKSGVIHLTRHLATDLAADNVNVNAIAPGLFLSNMTKHAIADEPTLQAGLEKIPRGRIGEPNDIAGTALFLCAPASSWMIGQTLVIDGGMTAMP